MRIVVLGPGALGCFFAARLALRSNHEVWLLDHDRERTEVLASKGLKLIEGEKSWSVKVRVALRPEEVGLADLVLLCVKSNDVALAVERLRPLVSRDNLLIALQNGIAHHRVLMEEYPGRWAIGVTAQGAALEGIGVVRHGGNGDTIIGDYAAENQVFDLLEKQAHILREAGIHTVVSQNIFTQVWKKFIVNVGINPLTVILNCSNGQILGFSEGRERLEKAVKEASRVAFAKGIDVGQDPVAMVEKVCESTAVNISSMLQDVRRQKKTEIDAINGALVHEASLLGISVPENEKLVQEVKEIEEQYLFS